MAMFLTHELMNRRNYSANCVTIFGNVGEII